jgi:hypothetical protein
MVSDNQKEMYLMLCGWIKIKQTDNNYLQLYESPRKTHYTLESAFRFQRYLDEHGDQ